MTKPFDVSRFRKGLTKSIDGLQVGFSDPTDWITSGNHTLNYLISGDFFKGAPLGKVTIFAGSSGAGKSFICSGNIVREAQKMGIFVVLIDSENALDESWLQALGVDTSEEALLKLSMSKIDDVAKTISEFMKEYKAIPEDKRMKVLFVIDSLGMLLTETDINQFEKGEIKGDMGRKQKALFSLVRNTVNMFGNYNVGMVCTNHTYQSQDPYNPDDIMSGGNGPMFASSIVVAMKKLKLKEDAEGNKVSEVLGIRAKCKIMKTRFSKPFEEVEIHIPYSTGMNAYSGLFELFERKGLLVKEGNRYTYTDRDSKEHKYFRKEYLVNTDGVLDLIMNENNGRDMQLRDAAAVSDEERTNDD